MRNLTKKEEKSIQELVNKANLSRRAQYAIREQWRQGKPETILSKYVITPMTLCISLSVVVILFHNAFFPKYLPYLVHLNKLILIFIWSVTIILAPSSCILDVIYLVTGRLKPLEKTAIAYWKKDDGTQIVISIFVKTIILISLIYINYLKTGIVLVFIWGFVYFLRLMVRNLVQEEFDAIESEKEDNERFYSYRDFRQSGAYSEARRIRQSLRRKKTNYEILEVAPGASREEIREAYRHLAAIYHPDKYKHLAPDLMAEAEERFKDISRAYHELTD